MQPRSNKSGVVLDTAGEVETLRSAIRMLKQVIPARALMIDVVMPVEDIESQSKTSQPHVELAKEQVDLARITLNVLAHTTDDPEEQQAAFDMNEALEVNQQLSMIGAGNSDVGAF
jgi:hypothetical protein